MYIHTSPASLHQNWCLWETLQIWNACLFQHEVLKSVGNYASKEARARQILIWVLIAEIVPRNMTVQFVDVLAIWGGTWWVGSHLCKTSTNLQVSWEFEKCVCVPVLCCRDGQQKNGGRGLQHSLSIVQYIGNLPWHRCCFMKWIHNSPLRLPFILMIVKNNRNVDTKNLFNWPERGCSATLGVLVAQISSFTKQILN